MLEYLDNKYIINDYGTDKQQEFIRRLLNNYNANSLIENWDPDSDSTSYVVDKGEIFAICLRDKTTGIIHDINTLRFVMLHELAHIGTIGFGHGEKFWDWFEFIVDNAVESHLYKPTDYSKNPIQYCGMSIKHNPFY